MSRQPTNLGKTNQIIDQLFEICYQYCPEEQKSTIEIYQYKFNLGRQTNSRMVVEKIMEVLSPYISHIMTRDESFFLNFNLQGVSENAQAVGILESLRQLWTTINDRVKDKVWKLLQLALMYGVQVTKNLTQLSQINQHRSTPLSL